MNQMLRPQIPAPLVARLAAGNFGIADPLLGANGPPIPSALEVRDLIEDLRDILFPGLTDGRERRAVRTERDIETLVGHIAARLARQIDLAVAATNPSDLDELAAPLSGFSSRATNALLYELPRLRLALVEDAVAAVAGDPAARGVAEVILCYPGHYAITVHRLAHVLWNYKVPLLPRMMSEHAHRVTGIDLHPGAHIGASFFIDHGTGVVVGETSIIGANVRLYQGVTLGALSVPTNEVQSLRNGPKRHPTIEDQVIIYANATILGGDTTIGRRSVIEGSSWVVESVPPGSRVSRRESVGQLQAG
jgi:serine O-acetyltransferase